MSDDNIKAKRYLQDRPFNIMYIDVSSSPTEITEELILFKEDYPDFIPVKDDQIVCSEEKFVVIWRTYSTEENTLFILAMSEKEYAKRFNSSKEKR